MKCPNCGEILTEEMKGSGICFNCGFNLLNYQETLSNKLRIQQEIVARSKYRSAWFGDSPEATKKFFQYKTVTILDKPDGSTDTAEIENTLNKLGYEGWRLVSVLSNELGKNSSSLTLSGVTTGTNATIDETILIFERIEFA